MLIEQGNPYAPGAPEVLRLGWDDFRFSVSTVNRAALGRRAQWTVLLYLAADCDLARWMFDDLLEAKSVGSSADVNVRWALATGYLPIRKSAGADPKMQAYWEEWEYNRIPYENLSFARTEPNVAGWQEVREKIEEALVAVLTKAKSGRQSAVDLKTEADAVLQNY